MEKACKSGFGITKNSLSELFFQRKKLLKNILEGDWICYFKLNFPDITILLIHEQLKNINIPDKKLFWNKKHEIVLCNNYIVFNDLNVDNTKTNSLDYLNVLSQQAAIIIGENTPAFCKIFVNKNEDKITGIKIDYEY